ncbi:MAG: hypothetical protein WBE34_18440 [Candidatus Nitrosopolaris sp.]
MKRSVSNLQTIVLASVRSSALLFGVVLSLHAQIADAKKSHQHNGSNIKDTKPDNTPDTANSASQTQQQQQQQPPIPGAIQLSAKAALGDYRWINPLTEQLILQ